ncbi:MAG: rRNA pseudouridine synthase [Bacteroidales bacterium]|nr:rRNA pseudouridine synthase [Bacteroidales bacterium]
MENNKKGTRTHFTRRPSEGRAEKVEYGRREGGYRPHREGEFKPRAERAYNSDFSTSRSFDSEEKPQRVYGARPARPQGERKPYGERKAYGSRPNGEKPYGEHKAYGERKSYGDKPYGERPRKSGYGKPSFGAKPAGRKPFQKRSEADAGMSAMLSRKPQVSGGAWSDDDTAKTPIKEVIRLNKYIANSGVCSRREADTLIQSGVVTVNGEVVTELGTKVNVLTDDVRFNGERLKGEEKVYIVMNKPKGYVTTASDPHAEKTVMDLLKGCPTRVFPVGRLDKNTTGVLMFTNDGEMAERLTHPSYNKKKIYQVILDHPLTEEDKEKVLAGIELTDGVIAADELEYIDARDHRQLGIEIHSGKNRIVRRIFESLGYEVKALDRVYFAGLTKKGLKKSDWRYLTEGEVNILKMGAYV